MFVFVFVSALLYMYIYMPRKLQILDFTTGIEADERTEIPAYIEIMKL